MSALSASKEKNGVFLPPQLQQLYVMHADGSTYNRVLYYLTTRKRVAVHTVRPHKLESHSMFENPFNVKIDL